MLVPVTPNNSKPPLLVLCCQNWSLWWDKIMVTIELCWQEGNTHSICVWFNRMAPRDPATLDLNWQASIATLLTWRRSQSMHCRQLPCNSTDCHLIFGYSNGGSFSSSPTTWWACSNTPTVELKNWRNSSASRQIQRFALKWRANPIIIHEGTY